MKTEAKSMMLKVMLDTSTLVQTSLSGTFIVMSGATGVFSISYTTPSSNNPDKAKDAGFPQYVAVWEVDDATAIYDNDDVKSKILITGSASTGSVSVKNFTRVMNKTYVVGYCYGDPSADDSINPIGAILTFKPGSNTGDPIIPSLATPIIVGSSSVYCTFSTPAGNNPHENRNWYGLAKGYSITNDGKQKWIKTVTCDSGMTNNNATAYLDDVPLTVNQTYTFAFGYYPLSDTLSGNPSVGMYYVFTAVPTE